MTGYFHLLKRPRFALLLFVATALLTACGAKKRYFEQVMPIIEQNDVIDAQVAQLPRVNAFKDPDYLTKLDGCIAAKQTLLSRLEPIQPPFLLATTHTKLVQAMRNGIRYLYSERQKFVIAAQKIAQMPPAQGSEEMQIIREYQSQKAAYQADMMEQMMKQQYERLYYEAKDELERAKKF